MKNKSIPATTPSNPFLITSPSPTFLITQTVLEIKHDDCVLDAISLMYSNNVGGAIIIDWCDFKKSVDRDIGFVEFSAMVLWCLEVQACWGRGVISAYSDQSLAETLHILKENQINEVAIVDRKSGTLISCVRSRDLYLLFEDDIIFSSRKLLGGQQLIEKALTAEEFANSRTQRSNQRIKTSAETDVCHNALCLRNDLLAGMTTPATSRKSDSLKQEMEALVASKSNYAFMVNESGQVEGVITIRDVISVFLPPCMDSRINGGGCFNSALEQVGCRVENGMMIQTS